MTPAPSVLPARHILVVDDDTQLREQMVGYLSEHGYLLHSASDGASMERKLAEAPIDLIVLDVMMPGEDGLSICRRLAQMLNGRISVRSIVDKGSTFTLTLPTKGRR